MWPMLPFWQGQQEKPGVTRSYPLHLNVRPDGYVGQADGPNRGEIVAGYAGADYGFITPPPGASEWGTAIGERKLRALKKFAGTLDGQSILEIGGGNLFFAQTLRREHTIARYVAIDPTLRVWPEDTGAEVHRAYYPCPELAGEKFDLVLANSCLEHIPDPRAFLAAIRDSLAETGRVFLTFPDVSRQFADGDLGAIVHEHFVYLDEPSARILFARCGFEVEQWATESDLASCLLKLADVGEGLSSEAAIAATALLARAIDGFSVRLPRAAAALDAELQAGRKIAFYGATNGLNNFLYATGIGCHVPVLDGDRAKRGRFLPAGTTSIKWVGDADLAQFERIVVTAASFQQSIVRSLTETYGVPGQQICGLFRRD